MTSLRYWMMACVAGAGLALAAADEPYANLPPFVITGRIVDYSNGAIDNAEVRVRAKDGVLLARAVSGAFDADTTANYAVSVPMSTAGTAGGAVAGDALTLELEAEGAVYADTNLVVTAGKAGRVLRLDLRAATSTNGTGVADAYLDEIRYDLEDLGLTRAQYDPQADYDGDGVSNYAEYLAGTDAFDAADAGLRILSFRAAPGDDTLMEATFLPGRNRAYSVRQADLKVDAKTFELRPHATSVETADAPRNYLVTGSEDPEVHVIYLYKDGAGSLYRLRLE